jgi:protein-tyrosine phosphatase
MARPRAGDWLEDEMRGLRTVGMNIIVSLLTDEEVAELELGEEPVACETAGLTFRRFPIRDREVPLIDAALSSLVRELRDEISSGKSVAIHCRMGIGRASLIASAVLSALGVEPSEALLRLTNARGLAIPDTEEQRRWILEFPARGTA